MTSSSKSEVWTYFVRAGIANKLKCSFCDVEVDHKGGSTSAAKRHLKRKHNVEITSTLKSANSNSSSESTTIDPKQPKLSQFLASKQPLSSDSSKAKALTYHVAKMIFCDLRPLSIVEDEGFRGLMSCAEKRYIIPSRTTFRMEIIPRLYNQCREIVKQDISNYKHRCGVGQAIFSITTDGWTSSNSNTSYVTYTLHMTGKSQIESYVLSTCELSQRHTAVNLRAHLLRTLQDWEILPQTAIISNATDDSDGETRDSDGENPGWSSHNNTSSNKVSDS